LRERAREREGAKERKRERQSMCLHVLYVLQKKRLVSVLKNVKISTYVLVDTAMHCNALQCTAKHLLIGTQVLMDLVMEYL